MTPESSDSNPLYGDNRVIENDNPTFNTATLSLGVDDLTQGNYTITALNLTLEGDTQMCSMALTTDYIGTANNARYSDPEIDALFQQAGQTNDTKEREALYNEIFSKVQEEAVYGVICNPYLLYAHNSELSCGEIPFEGFYQIYDFSWEA